MSKTICIVLSLVMFLITAAPVPLGTPIYSEETPEVELSNLPADPEMVEFQAEDGKNLVGYYYASKYADAPVIVLMHWAGGDQRDWCRIAPWLQNRLDEEPEEMPGCPEPPGTYPHWDPSWFPPIDEEISYSVFTFDFRDFGESQAGLGTPLNWGLDGVAAYKTASEMPRTAAALGAGKVAKNAQVVDALPLMIGIGSSIGADVVAWACDAFNALGEALCVGAISLSPGSYIDNNYTEDAQKLFEAEPTIPLSCLAGKGDYSASTCEKAVEYLYELIIYDGTGAHGTLMIDPDELYDPNVLDYILDFAEMIFNPPSEE